MENCSNRTDSLLHHSPANPDSASLNAAHAVYRGGETMRVITERVKNKSTPLMRSNNSEAPIGDAGETVAA